MLPRGLLSPQGLVLSRWLLLRRNKVTVTKLGVTGSGGTKEEGPGSGDLLRNVGIMAHIDAGKTTTTERFLYYSGVIVAPGEVHHGDTVTDYLPQERERGITIQSAVVSFPWKGHKVNLIDTPGHVDFTFEVQRALRVVDSAVAILDASAGVEAQTLTVWRQAAEYCLPKIIYLNKMDKSTASVEDSLASISSKLKCIPLLLQLPYYEKRAGPTSAMGSGLRGILDVVEMRRLIFDQDSKGVKIIPVDLSGDEKVRRRRAALVELVADLDSRLADLIIEKESLEAVTGAELHNAIRRVTISNQGVPVLLGSSYKNVGVQPLMDSILRYCPFPSGQESASSQDPVVTAYASSKELCSFAFKTMHDPQLGPLTFLRIFSGGIQSGQKIYNVSRGKHEKLGKIYLPLAEELTERGEAGMGEVVIVSGLKETITGDTLTSSHSVGLSVEKKIKSKSKERSRNQEREDHGAALSGVCVPEPVFFCSAEPASISQQKNLEAALECLKREDPSLHVHSDPDTGQMILSGMGELHLDIIHKRLQTEFKVDVDLGKIQVAYKETIASQIAKRSVFERRLGDQKHHVSIELELSPIPQSTSRLKLYRGRDKEKSENLSLVTDKQIKHIQNGIDSALRFGPKLSFPMIDIEVTLHWFETGRGTSDTIVEAAAASCLRDCVKEGMIYLLEPVVSLVVTVDEKYQRVVLDDLNRRRFILEAVDVRHGNKVISGTAPLSELMGYSTILRTISSGLGTFSSHFSHHQLVNNPLEEQKIITHLRGF